MLDTNICIYIIKKQPPSVLRRFEALQVGDVGISAVTFGELCFGVQKSLKREQNRCALELFTAPLEICPFDDNVGMIYGEVRSYLQESGKPIGPLDTLIASHAISLDLILVTNNTSEFSRVPHLKLESWV